MVLSVDGMIHFEVGNSTCFETNSGRAREAVFRH